MIRSELDVLLDRVQDQALRADLRRQVDRLKERRSFGLVFERHIPERVRLPRRPIQVGSQVVSRDDDDSPTYEVLSIADGIALLQLVRNADGAFLSEPERQEEPWRAPLESLVVISEFGEPVLPGLRYLDSVERGGDKPYQVVIKGENHHALEALRFTHAGEVDCIYIDPPYNSGARDWKYNNNYVDENDAYRHSKWLAFMERRLKLAKDLLNPENSVLIVTIDEREYLRLGMLLEQTFSGSRIQMITSVINESGVARGKEFYRAEEYLFFVFIGEAAVTPAGEDMLSRDEPGSRKKVDLWRRLLRGGTNARRQDRPNLFYPFWVDPVRERIYSVGDPLPSTAGIDSVIAPEPGLVACWPIRSDESEGNWQIGAPRAREGLRDGTVKLGAYTRTRARWSISYIRNAEKERIERGEIEIAGKDPNGALILRQSESGTRVKNPVTVWNQRSHNAGAGGTNVIRALLPGRTFPFPKSIYAVEDALRFFVSAKPDAVVLDFFAGAGTTAHAVMRLNRQDGGRRQSIMVTNNEVSVEEAADLRKRGFRPGDPEWERRGIFEHITRPRLDAAVTGKTPDGQPIKGDYKFTDEFPMADGFDENAAFLELSYVDPDDVDLGFAFDDLAPLLWLRAGAKGPIARATDDAGKYLPYVWTDYHGVIFDTDHWRAFVSTRPESAQAAFIVTYSPAVFASIAAELPAGMDIVRLYDSYLSRFMPERAGD